MDKVSREDTFVERGIMILGAEHSSHSICDDPLVDLRVGDLKVLEQLEEFPVLCKTRGQTWVAVDEGDETAKVSLLATPKEGIADIFWVFQGKEESVA